MDSARERIDRGLATYAAFDITARGRVHDEPEDEYRGEFQRDRDRVVHCGAFRRLVYKTQVFVNHEGDMFRNRLTHSIEVSQLARTVARVLCLNEDLTEAIALAHDLGHTPFGHAGQDALNACMSNAGGFEHNLQSLRIVDILEERYSEFPGLNLTFETREGILKHCSRANARELGDVGQRFLTGQQPGLEAQLANIADELAYNHHDADDGLRAGLISIEDMYEVSTFKHSAEQVKARWPGLDEKRWVHETVRRMINDSVTDLIESSRQRIGDAAPKSIEEVRGAKAAMIDFSPVAREKHLELKRFLRARLYRHHRVHRMAAKAKRTVSELFEAFAGDPGLLPSHVQKRFVERHNADADTVRTRVIADYLAGMTDRYAIAEHRRVFDPGSLT